MLETIDLSLIVPCRLDSKERVENLSTALKYYTSFCANAEIHVVEDTATSSRNSIGERPGVHWHYLPARGNFHKTRILNFGFFEVSNRPFVAAMDADVLVDPAAVHSALELLRSGSGMVMPFDGRFYNVKDPWRSEVISSTTPAEVILKLFESLTSGRKELPGVELKHPRSPGGAVFFSRSALQEFGGYDERFKTWGYEDVEIVGRAKRFGHDPVYSESEPLLHLWHPRFRKNFMWYIWPNRNRALLNSARELDRASILSMVSAGVYGAVKR